MHQSKGCPHFETRYVHTDTLLTHVTQHMNYVALNDRNHLFLNRTPLRNTSFHTFHSLPLSSPIGLFSVSHPLIRRVDLCRSCTVSESSGRRATEYLFPDKSVYVCMCTYVSVAYLEWCNIWLKGCTQSHTDWGWSEYFLSKLDVKSKQKNQSITW